MGCGYFFVRYFHERNFLKSYAWYVLHRPDSIPRARLRVVLYGLAKNPKGKFERQEIYQRKDEGAQYAVNIYIRAPLNVRFWHLEDMPTEKANICFRDKSGHAAI